MSRNDLFKPTTGELLEKLKNTIQKLSNITGTNDSRRDDEVSSALFYISSIVLKLEIAVNRNDIQMCQQIAIELYNFYQSKIKGLS